MIPEYKFFHGAVLADIVDRHRRPVTFREVVDEGRLLNYVINDAVGLQIKYSTRRLRPWGFSFLDAHLKQLQELVDSYPTSFAVLLCNDDGFVAIDASQLLSAAGNRTGGQSWFRVDRRKREMYRVFGPCGELAMRFRTTSEPIVEALTLLEETQKAVGLCEYAGPTAPQENLSESNQ
jgi:hypothetical protein